MRNQRGGAIYGLLAAIGFVVVVMAIAFAVCVGNAGGTPRSLGTIQLVRYDEQPRCYDEGCDGGYQGRDDDGGYEYRHDYSNHDRNRNRNRDRGAFSPGPFRDSPVVICAPYSCNSGGQQSGGNRENPPPGDQQPPPDQQPQSINCLVPVPWHCDPKPEAS